MPKTFAFKAEATRISATRGDAVYNIKNIKPLRSGIRMTR